MKLKILVLDDQLIYLLTWQHFLRSLPCIEVVDTTADHEDFLTRFHHYDLLIVDGHLEYRNGRPQVHMVEDGFMDKVRAEFNRPIVFNSNGFLRPEKASLFNLVIIPKDRPESPRTFLRQVGFWVSEDGETAGLTA